MENIYANPVGIIKKDIYIIKNRINDKVYIGQSINSKNRFREHCKGDYNNSLIDKAIQKYGKENFYYEILESQIENFNEKEVEWIEKMNTLTPNGYNILKGGQNPPFYKGETSPSAKLSDEEVCKIKVLLKETSEPLQSIADKFNISKRQIIRINQGISRSVLNEKYPVRENKNPSGKLTKEDVISIRELLEFTYLFNGEIARMFGVEVHTISKINEGKTHKDENISYPIREWKSCGKVQFTYEQVSEIINLLETTDYSFRKIAQIYGCQHGIISQINQGSTKKYRRKNLYYPIRNF